VSSNAHEGSTIAFDDLGHRKQYSGWTAYGASKLANILFTYELARRLEGTGVTVNAVHPGFVNTNFQQAAGLNMRGPLTPDEGADTVVWLATPKEVDGITGKYFVKRRDTRSSTASYDERVARRLWEVSMALVGLSP
jgi:NAD(P)-dependent dehydrogenase (short-subunit alcohol dehydrogenase family)